MSSPIFSEKSFAAWKQEGFSGETMTLKGAINKCLLLFATLLVPAAWVWVSANPAEGNSFFNPFVFNNLKVFLFGSAILGFILALVITFKKDWAPVLAPVYAAAQGIFLGLISSFFETIFPGIVLQAITITLLIFAAMLLAYRAGWLRATPMFTKVLMFATIGVGVFYLITIIMSMFGVQSFYMGNSWLSIGVSALIAGIAAFNLIMDFTLIDEQSKIGAPKYMEWYAAFGLMVTLIWLYLEILRLLSKLQSRD